MVVLGNDSRGLRSSEASEDEATFRSQRRPGGRERANDASLVLRRATSRDPIPPYGVGWGPIRGGEIYNNPAGVALFQRTLNFSVTQSEAGILCNFSA